MAIQTGDGLPRIDPDDPQFTHRGITVAVKIRVLMWPVILGCRKMPDGTWGVDVDLTDDKFGSDVAGFNSPVVAALSQHGGALQFLRNVVVPRLDRWLETLWKPVAAGEPTGIPATENGALAAIQTAFGAIKFTARPDGTVIATI